MNLNHMKAATDLAIDAAHLDETEVSKRAIVARVPFATADAVKAIALMAKEIATACEEVVDAAADDERFLREAFIDLRDHILDHIDSNREKIMDGDHVAAVHRLAAEALNSY